MFWTSGSRCALYRLSKRRVPGVRYGFLSQGWQTEPIQIGWESSVSMYTILSFPSFRTVIAVQWFTSSEMSVCSGSGESSSQTLLLLKIVVTLAVLVQPELRKWGFCRVKPELTIVLLALEWIPLILFSFIFFLPMKKQYCARSEMLSSALNIIILIQLYRFNYNVLFVKRNVLTC